MAGKGRHENRFVVDYKSGECYIFPVEVYITEKRMRVVNNQGDENVFSFNGLKTPMWGLLHFKEYFSLKDERFFVDYADALRALRARLDDIIAGTKVELAVAQRALETLDKVKYIRED